MPEPVEHIEYRDLTGPKWGHVRLYIDGVDHTMFRNTPAQIGELQYQDPYFWGPASFNLPQVEQWETWGEGDLAHIDVGKEVKAMRVDEDGVPRALMWKGFVAAPESDIGGTELSCAGWISGRLMTRWWSGPTNEKRKDVGLLIHDALHDAGVPSSPKLGIRVGMEFKCDFPPSWYLELVDNLLGLGTHLNTNQLTVMVDPDDIHGRAVVRHRDRVVTAKVFLGPGAKLRAGREITEEPTTIYGSSQNKNGELERNIAHPVRMNGDPVPPPVSELPLSEGDENDWVFILKTRLVTLGYLDRADGHTEVGGVLQFGTFNLFNAATTDAVKDLQRKAGLSRTGIVNTATWNAMYDLKRRGKYQKKSFVMPWVQLDEVRRWNYTGTGVIESPNALYDPDRLKVDRHVEIPVNKRRGILWADRYMDRVHEWGPPHVGQATLDLDLFPPGHEHGDPLAVEDRMSLMDIRRQVGTLVEFDGYQGNKSFHVAGASLNCDAMQVVADVDTSGRDLQEVIDIVARRHETRNSHSRQHVKRGRGIGNAHRKSSDEHAGHLPDSRKCGGNQWSVFEIDWGQAAFARKIRVEVERAKCPFVFALFGQKVTRAQLNNWFGNPRESGKWETATARRLADEEDVLLFAAGDEDQPGGYSPGRRMGANNELTGDPVTGLLLYTNPISIHTHGALEKNTRSGSLYGAIFPWQNCQLPMQRIATPMPNDND
jgi:peptidoglycan hydrolase-like protein with peptidoglycan-binding domain